MQSLVIENIYEEVNITDYQAVCYMSINDGNPANILQTVCIFIQTQVLKERKHTEMISKIERIKHF